MDEFVFKKVSLITTPGLTRFMYSITFFGSLNFLLPAYLVIILFDLYIKDKKLFLYIFFIGIGTTGLLFLLKFLFKRLRPSDPLLHAVNGFSFPSGHSFSGFTFFGILIYIIWNDTKLKRINKWLTSILLFGIAATIAFSRIYLHVHFASDVIAGFCLSVICLTSAYWLLKTITNRQLAEIKIPDPEL
ncbi:MAG: phosphatase PAP2 family protein [Bacteroidota bacterium]